MKNKTKDSSKITIYATKLETIAAVWGTNLEAMVHAKTKYFRSPDEEVYVFDVLPFNRSDYREDKDKYIVDSQQLDKFCTQLGIQKDYLTHKDTTVMFTHVGKMKARLIEMGLEEGSSFNRIMRGFFSLSSDTQLLTAMCLKTWANSTSLVNLDKEKLAIESILLAKSADVVNDMNHYTGDIR